MKNTSFIKIEQKFYKQNIVILLLSLTLLIDAITGVMMKVFGVERSPFGIVFRIGLISYFLAYWVYKNIRNKKRMIFFSGIIIYFFINIMYSYLFIHNQYKGILFDIIETSKLMLFPIIFIGLIELKRYKVVNYSCLKKVMDNSINLLLIIYLFGLFFGLGEKTYSGAGYKSVFNANNSFNIVVIVLFIFQVEKTIKQFNKINSIKSMSIALILVLLGSKTSIMFIPLYMLVKVIMQFKKLDVKILIKGAIILIFSIFLIYIIFNEQILNIINHQLYFLNRESNSLITYFLSGRDKFLEIGFQYYISNFSIITLLLGVGMYSNQLYIGEELGRLTVKNIEMDFFDILFSNGAIGIILTFGLVTYVLVKNKNKIINNEVTAEFISIFSMLLFSFLAGHVFPDALSSTYLAILVVMVSIKGDKNYENSNFTFW